MKKKLILIPLLVLALMASIGTPVAAWDVEDPCVASNEDFIDGVGWDGDAYEQHYGEQSWSYGETPSDGYNLYQDDASNTGNLDKIWSLITRTPDAIDLPGATVDYYPDWDGGLYYITIESPNTYYWATEPRGYDFTKAEILQNSGVPGKGLDTAPGLQKPFNPNSKAVDNAGKK